MRHHFWFHAGEGEECQCCGSSVDKVITVDWFGGYSRQSWGYMCSLCYQSDGSNLSYVTVRSGPDAGVLRLMLQIANLQAFGKYPVPESVPEGTEEEIAAFRKALKEE